jgi:acyltransferase
MRRLGAIDAHRGLVVLLMVMHHTVDAWILDADRHGPLYVVLRHLGGVPAPGFLFLAGLSGALVAAREREKGVATSTRVRAGIGRGLYVLGIAFAFRLVSFVFGGGPLSGWPMIFRVDILNCMGVALSVVAVVCGSARSRTEATRRALLLGALSFGLAPLVWGRTFDVPSLLLGNYVGGSGPLVMFPLFPWLGFLAVGTAAGEGLAAAHRSGSAAVARWCLRLALGGVLLIAGGWLLGRLPASLYPTHDYWKSSPLYMAIRLGAQFVVAGLLARWAIARPASFGPAHPLVVLGRHSLAIYLVHIELVYGHVSGRLHGALGVWAALAGMAAVNALSFGLAVVLERRERADSAVVASA